LYAVTSSDLTKILKEGTDRLGLSLSDHAVAQFVTYATELTRWNQRVNLTTLRSDRDIAVKHFLDSLTVLCYVTPGARLMDIGTGAGFPGVPLKIACPPIHLVLMDGSQKKVFFLRHLIRQLGLSDTETLHGRAETLDMMERHGGRFDLVLSRAVAPLRSLLPLMAPYAAAGGMVVAMRGRKGEADLKDAHWTSADLDLSEIRRVTLPIVEEQRVVLVFRRRFSSN